MVMIRKAMERVSVDFRELIIIKVYKYKEKITMYDNDP